MDLPSPHVCAWALHTSSTKRLVRHYPLTTYSPRTDGQVNGFSSLLRSKVGLSKAWTERRSASPFSLVDDEDTSSYVPPRASTKFEI